MTCPQEVWHAVMHLYSINAESSCSARLEGEEVMVDKMGGSSEHHNILSISDLFQTGSRLGKRLRLFLLNLSLS